MCGIAGAFRAHKNKTLPLIAPRLRAWELYQDQAARGSEGFGLSCFAFNQPTMTIRATTEATAYVDLRLLAHEPDGVLLHHRWPTSTDNLVSQTHPIVIQHPTALKHSYLVAHNGIISNCQTMKGIHKAAGFAYTTELPDKKFNDSESAAVEFALAIESKDHAIRTTGSQALAALQLDAATRQARAVYFATNGTNPLNFIHDPAAGYLEFASELQGGTPAVASTLYRFDLATGTLTTRPLAFVAAPKPLLSNPTSFGKPAGSYVPYKYRAVEYDKASDGYFAKDDKDTFTPTQYATADAR
jgi:glutamine phosphoribosylpyrophosphate amidotransferase